MIYLDIETLDFFQDERIKSLTRGDQLQQMRFGCAVTYDSRSATWQEWPENQIVDLYKYLVWCNCPVVGWNIWAFDWPIIIKSAERAGWTPLELETESIRFIDLFDLIRSSTGRWYKLEDVVQYNLGRGKLADGQQAAEWLRSGDSELIERAIEYCHYDVELVVTLHQHLLNGGYLTLPPRIKRYEINEVRWWLNGQTQWIPDAVGAVSTR